MKIPISDTQTSEILGSCQPLLSRPIHLFQIVLLYFISSMLQEALDGYRKCAMSESPEDIRQRAMNDPEVQAILGDPAMRLILEQMQKDPNALKE